MSVAGVLARGRARAALTHTDTIKVVRESGTTWDESTGQHVPTLVTVYEGPGRVSLPSTSSLSRTETQGLVETAQGPVLKLPIEAPAGASGDPGQVTTGDVAEVLASAEDAALVGRKLRVVGIQPQSHATQRRFPAEVTT